MSRLPLLIISILMAGSSTFAGTIQFDKLDTYDTGIRLANGRWKIGAQVQMTYLNFLGDVAPVDWEAELWINNVYGSVLASTGPQFFRSTQWICNIQADANFAACYRGRSYAKAGGETQDVGGNYVCTDPRPPPDPPPCNEGCHTPLVLSLRGGYHMTSPAAGVSFDIDADGSAEEIAWTEPNGDVGFLAIDRNGNGRIDSGAELFGDSTTLTNGVRALNGFEALADLDSNHDARIDKKDSSWPYLLLWFDTNHDGSSAATELVPIGKSGVTAISTDCTSAGKKDAFGNEFRLKGEFLLNETWHKCYDVYLVTAE
jgi:hypothetical protein